MEVIIKKLASLIKVSDLMTSNVQFYEDLENPVEFCIKRDIEKLPLKDMKRYKLYNKSSKTFSEKVISFEEIISSEMSIDKFIEKTKAGDLFFVVSNNRIIGVIHFCDLINSWAYVYFYAIFHEFEKEVRKVLGDNDKHNTDFIRWYEAEKIEQNKDENARKQLKNKIEQIKKKKEKIILPKFQHFDLRDLLDFMIYEKIKINNFEIDKDIFNRIADIRNIIMHHKDISPRQNNFGEGGELLYRRDHYDKFLEGYFWLIEVLK